MVSQAWATGGAVAILCVCKRAEGCHRRVVSDTFQSLYDGIEVHDITEEENDGESQDGTD